MRNVEIRLVGTAPSNKPTSRGGQPDQLDSALAGFIESVCRDVEALGVRVRLDGIDFEEVADEDVFPEEGAGPDPADEEE